MARFQLVRSLISKWVLLLTSRILLKCECCIIIDCFNPYSGPGIDNSSNGCGTASLSEERAKLGAVSNRLDSTVANLDQIAVNLSASQGRIEDADFAQETANLAKGQILQQVATAMVAQANASKSTVLTLLRG